MSMPLTAVGCVDAKETGWHVSALLVWKSLEGWKVGLVLLVSQSVLTPPQPSHRYSVEGFEPTF